MNARTITQTFVIALCALAMSVPSHAGKVSTRVKYYTVTGSTARQLNNNMRVPRGFFSREKAAYADITINPDFAGKVIEGKTCRLKGFRIDASYLVRLPRLASGTRLPPRLSRQYKRFLAFVTRHEYHHRKIYQGCVARAERKIKRLRARTCKILGRRFVAIFKQEWNRCKVLNARFDAAEQRRLKRQSFVRAAMARQPSRTRHAIARPKPHRMNRLSGLDSH